MSLPSPASRPSAPERGSATPPWQALADAATDLILSAGADGRLQFLNRTGCAVLGCAMAEAGRLTLHDLVDPMDHPAIAEVLERARAGEAPPPLDLTMLARGGHRVRLVGSFSFHREEQRPVAIIGVFREGAGQTTSGWKKSLAEQQIIQNVAREKELTELKSHFISMASHELRTPLAALSLGVDFLVKYWQKLPPDQINKNLKSVDATVRQLRSVLDDVLIISRDEEGRLRCKRSAVELVAFARKVAEEAAATDQYRHPISVHCVHEACEAAVDPQLLSHILANLLGNACKYSPPGAAVELTLQRTDGQVGLEIADRGIGIPAEDQPRLFALFYRGSNVGATPGTGLGLVVVRRCVEAHHGSITFTSVPGSGTRFTVSLPVEAPV